MKDRYHFFRNEKICKVELQDDFDFFYFKPTLFKQKLHKGLYKQSDLLYLFWYVSCLFSLKKLFFYKLFLFIDI